MDSIEFKIKGLIASAENMIGVIKNQQWERLPKKVSNLEFAISKAREALPQANVSGSEANQPEKKDGEVALPSDGEIINKIDLLTDNQANFANEKGVYSPSRAFDTLRTFIKWTRTV